MSSRNGWIVCIVLATAHLVLAILYSQVTPFMTPGRVFLQGGGREGIETIDIGAPDELQHVVYVARMAAGEGIPTLKPGDPKLDFTYQSHQPPLFYAVAGLWMRIAAPDLVAIAPYVQNQEGGKIVETLKQRAWFEVQPGLTYESVQTQGKRLRWLNAFFGALTVLAVGYFGIVALGRPEAAVGGAVLVALLPMGIALSGSVSNDPLLFCLIAWATALLAGEAVTGLCWKRGLFIGLLVGLAFLTKTTALALVPVGVVALWVARKEMPFRLAAPGLGLAFLIGGAWWGRNVSVYGEPFVIRTFNEAFRGRSPLASEMIERVGASQYWSAVWELTSQSFVGVFSYMDILFPNAILPQLTLALVGILMLASVAGIRRAELPSLAPVWMILTLLLVVAGLFVQFNLGYYQAQARYLLPAALSFGGFVGLGCLAVPRERSLAVAGGLAVWLILVNAYVLNFLPSAFEPRILPVAP